MSFIRQVEQAKQPKQPVVEAERPTIVKAVESEQPTIVEAVEAKQAIEQSGPKHFDL